MQYLLAQMLMVQTSQAQTLATQTYTTATSLTQQKIVYTLSKEENTARCRLLLYSHKHFHVFVSLMYRDNLRQADFFSLESSAEPVGHVGGDHAARATTAYAVFAKDAMHRKLEGNAGDFACWGFELVLDMGAKAFFGFPFFGSALIDSGGSLFAFAEQGGLAFCHGLSGGGPLAHLLVILRVVEEVASTTRVYVFDSYFKSSSCSQTCNQRWSLQRNLHQVGKRYPLQRQKSLRHPLRKHSSNIPCRCRYRYQPLSCRISGRTSRDCRFCVYWYVCR